jgi:hypothetical protein
MPNQDFAKRQHGLPPHKQTNKFYFDLPNLKWALCYELHSMFLRRKLV